MGIIWSWLIFLELRLHCHYCYYCCLCAHQNVCVFVYAVHLFVYMCVCAGVHVRVQVCDVIVHSLFTGTFTRRQTDMYMVDRKLKTIEFQGQ